MNFTPSSANKVIASFLKKLRFELYIDHIIFIYNLISLLASFGKAKSVLPKVKSTKIVPWPQPDPKAFPPGKKLLWGFWNSGRENMPPFVKLCIESWEVNNPEWVVTIISDNNFHQFVAADELPSTFHSLKVQHRSDIIRVAVLLRYGGVYMDVSTMCFKGLDDLIDSDTTPELLLQPAWTQSNGIPLPNNAILISRKPNNSLLSVFLKRMISYWENPALTVEEMKDRPEFCRVFFTTQDPNQGFVAGTDLYAANLLLLADLLWFGETAEYAKENVQYLSHWQWGLPDFRADPTNGVAQPPDMSKVHTLKLLPNFGIIIARAKCFLEDDEKLAQAVYDRVCVMKFSSEEYVGMKTTNVTKEELLSSPTTYGRILRKAMDSSNIHQAKLEGARNVVGAFV